jgi:hypothetical protein
MSANRRIKKMMALVLGDAAVAVAAQAPATATRR